MPLANRLAPPRGVFLRHPASIALYPIFEMLRPYTMVAYESLLQMQRIIKDADTQHVQGAIVETGCWRGGCGAFMSWASKRNGSNRATYLFDSFEGFPEPREEDEGALRKTNTDKNSFAGYNSAAYEDAEEILKKLNVSATLVKGWFKDTLPAWKERIGPIAILRMDGDLYESTLITLQSLYDQVAEGGSIVIDDYGFAGCRQALYEFFAARRITPELRFGGTHERVYFIKQSIASR